jgi:hypothetical protein
MDSDWNRPLRVATDSGRLILVAPEISDTRLGTRDQIEIDIAGSNKTSLLMCFGGSTTFGHGVKYDETWPEHLSRSVPDFEVLNFGVCKNDIKASLSTLISLLRIGYRPSILVFLDGLNEFSGFTKWDRNQQGYIDFDTNYLSYNSILHRSSLLQNRIYLLFVLIFGTRGIKFSKGFGILLRSLRGDSRPYSLGSIVKVIVERYKNREIFFDRGEFVDATATSYVQSKRTIQVIAKAFGVRHVFFFLQPSIFNVEQGQFSNPRASYMRELFHKICELDSDVIDISGSCGKLMSVDMFFDWQHCDGRGNEIISKEIASFIYESIGTR